MSEMMPAVVGTHMARYFDRAGVAERFATPDAVAEYIWDTPFEEADQHFVRINRIVRGDGADKAGLRTDDQMVAKMRTSIMGNAHEALYGDLEYLAGTVGRMSMSMAALYTRSRLIENHRHAGLALRLGIELTQRALDGHTRSGAIVGYIRGNGYSGSDADKSMLWKVATGQVHPRIKNEFWMTAKPLLRIFTGHIIRQAIAAADYDGPLPDTIRRYKVIDLALSNSSLDESHTHSLGFSLNEHRFGYALAMEHMLAHGNLQDLLVLEEGGLAYDPLKLMRSLTVADADRLVARHDAMKAELVYEVSTAFVEGNGIFGDADTIHRLTHLEGKG